MPSPPRARRSLAGIAEEAGYNMVILVIAITVLNIVVAAMLPLWSTQIQREKEEELVFRGFQYAEAIRVFHAALPAATGQARGAARGQAALHPPALEGPDDARTASGC